MPNYFNVKLNQGDDAAGIVEAVGKNVRNFKKGDRVAGFHQMDTPRGAYAEYTVCPDHTVFHIPESMSFEEAATMPLTSTYCLPLSYCRLTESVYTAAVGLYRSLAVPLPFGRVDDSTPKTPLVINGASGAVGSFALKFAALNSSVYPIIAIAGANSATAKELGAHIILDYRSPTIAADLVKALEGKKVMNVFDCVPSVTSTQYLLPILDPKGKYSSTTGIQPEQKELLQQWGGWFEQLWVGSVHDDKPAGGIVFGSIITRLVEGAVAQGKFSGLSYTIVKGGLNGVKDALIQLRDRKGGNEKFITRIADTEGL